MRFNVVSYLIGEGISNIFKNKKSTISSLMIMCATMIVFGLFFVIGENINSFVENVAEAQGLNVFIDINATETQIENVGNEILGIEGVRNVVYVSPEEGYEIMKERLGEETLEGYTSSIFQSSYLVTLTDLELNEEVQDSIMQIANVESIESSNQTIAQIIRLAKGVRIVTAVILALLIIISISIIANTIKLTVHARRKEISIMKYVGATNSFIRWPFLVEGVILGILAGIISVILIGGAYTYIANQMSNSEFMLTIGWKMMSFKEMFNLIVLVYLGIGAGIGVIGSSISMRKYLEV